MSLDLPKDSFLAIAAIAWADGVFAPEEGQGLLRAARSAGLPADELAQIEGAVTKKITIPEIETIRMSRGDRVLTYALATWLARLDGVVSPEEKDSLKLLGDRLGLPDGIRTRASAAAFEVANLPAGDRPDRYDFEALKSRILAKLGDVEAE
jgi:tellurite resistance protein